MKGTVVVCCDNSDQFEDWAADALDAFRSLLVQAIDDLQGQLSDDVVEAAAPVLQVLQHCCRAGVQKQVDFENAVPPDAIV